MYIVSRNIVCGSTAVKISKFIQTPGSPNTVTQVIVSYMTVNANMKAFTCLVHCQKVTPQRQDGSLGSKICVSFRYFAKDKYNVYDLVEK